MYRESFLIKIVDIVGGHKGNTRAFVQGGQPRQEMLRLGQIRVDHFQVDLIPPENIKQTLQLCLGLIQIAAQDGLTHTGAAAAAEHD